MKYTVRSGSRRVKFEVKRNTDFSRDVPIEIGKRTYTVRVHEMLSNGERNMVSVNNRVLSLQVRRRPDGIPYKVIINGTAYPVEMERIESARYRPPAPERKIDGRVKAVLPGQITRVFVEEGARVKQGQVLMILEAMKMENEITAPLDGVVTNLSVRPNQLIAKNQALLEVV